MHKSEGVILLDWNSAQYLKFVKERTQPSLDLISRIKIENPAKIIDIGCGPGNSTNALYEKFPNAEIVGLDNSNDMLEKARNKYPFICFMEFDAACENWNIGKDYDIVFSNACIQWVPDHYTLLPKMMSVLKKGGIMAVQMPIQRDEPIRKIIAQVISTDKWKHKLEFKRTLNMLSDEKYFDILSELSDDFNIWTTTYFHRMKSCNDIIEWYKSTGLKPYLDCLDENDKVLFLKDVHNEVSKCYKNQDHGEIILKFPRLFFTAIK